MNAELHKNAVQKIENEIKGSLLNCQIKDNWPQYESFSIHVGSLAEEVLKHKKEWLDRPNIFSIFYDIVYDAIKENTKADENWEGNLWDLLGKEKGLKLTESIKNYILSIPLSYDVYIPIQKAPDTFPARIKLSDNISLVVFKNADQIPGGYKVGLLSLHNELELNKIYFKQSLIGYCGKRLESVSYKKAISNFKILIQQGIFRDLFKLNTDRKSGLGLLGYFTYYQVPKASVISIDRTTESLKRVSVELPMDFSSMIDSIDFNWEGDLLTNLEDSGKQEEAIAIYFRKAIELIECVEEESRRVKSAIEWCFDSYIVQNQTLAFLQVCIGLEALFGDERQNKKQNERQNIALTETLADRCSYLIGSDIKGRKKIKEEFKELYGVRSDLVHGSITELDNNQKRYLNWGRSILKYSISKEIKHLNLGKT